MNSLGNTAMNFVWRCPIAQCGATLHVSATLAGKPVRCPACQGTATAPAFGVRVTASGLAPPRRSRPIEARRPAPVADGSVARRHMPWALGMCAGLLLLAASLLALGLATRVAPALALEPEADSVGQPTVTLQPAPVVTQWKLDPSYAAAPRLDAVTAKAAEPAADPVEAVAPKAAEAVPVAAPAADLDKDRPLPMERLAAVTRGKGVRQAAAYHKTDRIHPAWCLAADGSVHAFNEEMPAEWRAGSVEETELVIVIGPEGRTFLSHTRFVDDAGRPAPGITRVRTHLMVGIVEAKTGKRVAQQHFFQDPRLLNAHEPGGFTELAEPVPFATVARWLWQYIDPFKAVPWTPPSDEPSGPAVAADPIPDVGPIGIVPVSGAKRVETGRPSGIVPAAAAIAALKSKPAPVAVAAAAHAAAAPKAMPPEHFPHAGSMPTSRPMAGPYPMYRPTYGFNPWLNYRPFRRF